MAQMNAPRRELSIAFRIVKIDLIPRKLGTNIVGASNPPVTKPFSIAILWALFIASNLVRLVQLWEFARVSSV